MESLAGKVAAVTGAGSGIGRELAVQLAQAGCSLALCDIDEQRLGSTVDTAVAKSGGAVKVSSSCVDVSDREAVYRWADEAASEHGRVNMIFNNAGVALGSSIEGVSYEDFEWLFGINFWGVVYGTKAFLPHLRASGEGHVVNISSVFGLISVPSQSAYNAAKSAVSGFTEALRMELEMSNAPVSATCVYPGGIKTNVARSSRMDASIADLGLDAENGREKFEKLFVTEPEKAAKVILEGVKNDDRRVLIGADARVIDGMARLLPASYQHILKRFARRTQG